MFKSVQLLLNKVQFRISNFYYILFSSRWYKKSHAQNEGSDLTPRILTLPFQHVLQCLLFLTAIELQLEPGNSKRIGQVTQLMSKTLKWPFL